MCIARADDYYKCCRVEDALVVVVDGSFVCVIAVEPAARDP